MSTEPISAGFDMTRELLIVIGKILDRLPTYSQKKREKYYNLLQHYEEEMSRNYDERDDNVIGVLRMELGRFVKVFSKELEINLKAEWVKK